MKLYAFYIALALVVSCQGAQVDDDPEDPVLASVYDQQLKFSSIKPLLQTEASPEDSIQYTHALIEKWVRDAILMHEAERNIPADLDIQKMVNDYRSSLILMTYKQQLVEEKLDTFINQQQLEHYYDDSKNQYMLDEPILQCLFFRVANSNGEKLESVEELWKEKEYEALTLLPDETFDFMLPDSTWYTWKDINALIPKGSWSLTQLKGKEARSKSTDDFKYFIKVSEYVDKNEIAPLTYIEDQAKKVILHKRQTEILENLMEDLYNQYANNSNVKINI